MQHCSIAALQCIACTIVITVWKRPTACVRTRLLRAIDGNGARSLTVGRVAVVSSLYTPAQETICGMRLHGQESASPNSAGFPIRHWAGGLQCVIQTG